MCGYRVQSLLWLRRRTRLVTLDTNNIPIYLLRIALGLGSLMKVWILG